jgi:hypothetical protein
MNIHNAQQYLWMGKKGKLLSETKINVCLLFYLTFYAHTINQTKLATGIQMNQIPEMVTILQ